MILDSSLSVDKQFKAKKAKLKKTVCLMRNVGSILLRKSLLSIYESFLKPLSETIIGRNFPPALFQNLKKSALNLGKNALTRFIYGFNFSFKMQFQGYLGKKYPKFFPAGTFFRILQIKCSSKRPYFQKPSWLRAWTNNQRNI